MNHDNPRATFLVGGVPVARDVPAEFMPHVMAEQARDMMRLHDLARSATELSTFAARDARDLVQGQPFASKIDFYRAEAARIGRSPDDGETAYDVWTDASPLARRDALLGAAWAARTLPELPPTPGAWPDPRATAEALHEFARQHPGDNPGTFLPMPGGPLPHPAALIATTYLDDTESDPVEQCSALLILAYGAVRARAAKKS
ncbi:hypothetical protein ACFXPX_04475 [Kitasatospora sp. NPDC059146]|uniref:hypothetical protein n=1 Tax=unclassified Kitasatospora TaxID=2633591 RepID=UPI0036B89B9E